MFPPPFLHLETYWTVTLTLCHSAHCSLGFHWTPELHPRYSSAIQDLVIQGDRKSQLLFAKVFGSIHCLSWQQHSEGNDQIGNWAEPLLVEGANSRNLPNMDSPARAVRARGTACYGFLFIQVVYHFNAVASGAQFISIQYNTLGIFFHHLPPKVDLLGLVPSVYLIQISYLGPWHPVSSKTLASSSSIITLWELWLTNDSIKHGSNMNPLLHWIHCQPKLQDNHTVGYLRIFSTNGGQPTHLNILFPWSLPNGRSSSLFRGFKL